MKRKRLVGVMVSLLVLGGCGPSDDIDFHPPQNWVADPHGDYYRPADSHNPTQWIDNTTTQSLTLLRTSPGRPLQSVVLKILVEDPYYRLSRGKPNAIREMHLCGNQESLYVRTRAFHDTTEYTVESVASNAPDTTYVVSYIYPVAASPNRDAQAALYELCPKPASASSPSGSLGP